MKGTSCSGTLSTATARHDRAEVIVEKDANWDPLSFDPAVDIGRRRSDPEGILKSENPNIKPFFDRGGKLSCIRLPDPQVTSWNAIRYHPGGDREGEGRRGKSVELSWCPACCTARAAPAPTRG